MNLRPLHDRIIVKSITNETKSTLGIIIPDTAGDKGSKKGEVVAVGPGRRKESGEILPMALKVGDKVVFKPYAPEEIKVGDETYLVMAESDVVAVIES